MALSASERARRLYPRSKAFQGAFVKGAAARRRGALQESCPYKPDPRKTWLRAYRRAWMRGYESSR